MAEFKFFCPQCGQRIQCDISYSGRQINCPVCQQAIVVPPPPRADGATPVPVKPQTLRKALVIAASVFALAILVVGGWFGYSKIRIYILGGHLPPGLVALWSGEGDGKDSIGGNNATLKHMSFAKGKVGRAFSFNGANSYLTVPASPSLDVGAGDGLTITAWINPNKFHGVAMPIVEWDSPSAGSLSLWVESSLQLSGGFFDTSGNGHAWHTANNLISTSSFQYVAMTYDKNSGTAVLYINGVAAASQNFGSVTPQTTYPVSIGRRTASIGGNGDTFGGLIDELAIYNRALSAAEIEGVYAEQK